MLDFGCGTKPYRDKFVCTKYIGIDVEESGADPATVYSDLTYDGKTLPFTDDSFDSIFSSEVFEHVFNLDEILGELDRVLKPGGVMLVTVPFVWEEHEVPYDFGRYTSFGLRHLFERHNLQVEEIRKSTTYIETVFQLLICFLVQNIIPKNKYIAFLVTPIVIAPLTVLGIALSRVMPNNGTLYLNNVALVRKPA